MKRLLLAIVLCLGVPAAFAQQRNLPPGGQSTVDTHTTAMLPADAPVKSELDKVFTELGDQVQRADTLLKQLRETANRKPEDVV
jgi:flagellar biosynthesis/type III secretory pathway M-ring protein FliF/YscJ